MQRYDPIGRDGEYYPDLMDPRDEGDYVLHAEAQAEIDALHKECDRLTALLEKPKVLEAHKVTEPGFYWWSGRSVVRENTKWQIVEVVNTGSSFVFLIAGGEDQFTRAGRFIGPLPAPEVD